MSTRVIGHRGLGKNNRNHSLAVGENTVESFIAAASLGRLMLRIRCPIDENVPVIYHDFTVAESGVDVLCMR